MKKGKLVLVAGPSGVGKRTIWTEIIKDPTLELSMSISLTTREKRAGEIDGVDYIFVSKEEFKEKIKNNEMLEYAEFFNNYYGTSNRWVEGRLEKGKNVLLEIETEGFKQIKEKFPDLISIFILPTSLAELERRLRIRGTEDEEKIAMRLKKAEKEIADSHLFTYQVVNDVLEVAIEEVRNILKNELQ